MADILVSASSVSGWLFINELSRIRDQGILLLI